MGLNYLWDANAVIYYLQKNFSESGQKSMTDTINSHQPAISVITEIELLCWKAATAKDVTVLKNFVSDCIVFELEREIKLKTIEIRKTYNIKLADAIIAATATSIDLTLITNDKRGFNKLPSLRLLNPDSGK